MILQLIIVYINLMSITARERNCESPVRNKATFFNVQSEKEFCLWYKMDEKNTQVNITYTANVYPTINYYYVWSNTEEYASITSAAFLEKLWNPRKISIQINSVSITGNAIIYYSLTKNKDQVQ
ncbi:uncharacterized protein [Cherax quadricarinatus]|uniref:uncharacterized protein n=1 Tax=Cherax quadricarinatus TaxID=27406 RepID=UPI00387E3685